MTEFIDEQLSGELRPDEQILHRGYLQSAMSGSILSGLRAKGYWVALTTERLIFIKTDVGATKPLLRNKGIEAIEHAEISAAVVTRAGLQLVTTDKRKWSLVNAHKKKVPTTEALMQELQTRWGQGDVADAMTRSGPLKYIVNIGLVLLGLALGVYWITQQKDDRASVECVHLSVGTTCKVTNQSQQDVEACFRVTLTCANGERVKARPCINVPSGRSEDVIPSFIPYECERATKVEVSDVDTESL